MSALYILAFSPKLLLNNSDMPKGNHSKKNRYALFTRGSLLIHFQSVWTENLEVMTPTKWPFMQFRPFSNVHFTDLDLIIIIMKNFNEALSKRVTIPTELDVFMLS